MIWGTFLQTALVAGLAFILVSLQWCLLYSQHSLASYCWKQSITLSIHGLERNLRDNGRFERVQPHHSWNCNRSLGRLVLFELTRHSDHHAHAKRPYQVLRHYETAPQLPAGYPAMILMALVPPLWFSIMNQDWNVTDPINRVREMHALRLLIMTNAD